VPLKPPTHRPPGLPSREEREARRKAALDQRRPSAAARGYDRAWQRCRRLFLEKNPTCAMCGAKATEVDHVISVRERPDLRLSWSNLRAMDARCHSRRTALEQGFARRPEHG
jgi:5-methylcytosine-specific restriction protein A